jgi:hypothetical protein
MAKARCALPRRALVRRKLPLAGAYRALMRMKKRRRVSLRGAISA